MNDTKTIIATAMTISLQAIHPNATSDPIELLYRYSTIVYQLRKPMTLYACTCMGVSVAQISP